MKKTKFIIKEQLEFYFPMSLIYNILVNVVTTG